MLLLLDTDGGEKKFNSLLIYSLPTKISVNVNYPNHFHVWHMKTEKSECLYFLLVEERVNCKYFQYLLITHFSHPQCSHFPWSCPFPQPGHTQLTPDKAGKHCSTFCLRTAPSWGQGRKCSACPTHSTEQLWSSGLTPAPLSPLQSKASPQLPGLGLEGAVPFGQTCSGLDPVLLIKVFPRGFQLRVSELWSLCALGRAPSAPQGSRFGGQCSSDTNETCPHSSCRVLSSFRDTGSRSAKGVKHISLEERGRTEGGFELRWKHVKDLDLPCVWQAGERSWNGKVRWMRSWQASWLPQGCLMYQRARTKCAISAASRAGSVTFEVLIFKTRIPQCFSSPQRIKSKQFPKLLWGLFSFSRIW